MLRISYNLGKRAINVLMDGSPSSDVMERIVQTIAETPDITSFHKLRARYVGNKLLIELHLHIPQKMTLKKAHEIAHDVKKRLMKEIPDVKDVMIHIEPAISHED